MKQPDLRAGVGGKPGVALLRRAEYRDFRQKQIHAHWQEEEARRDGINETRSETPSDTEEFPWVSTPTAERVIAGLRYAQFAHDIVVIYGGSGLGKSHCIHHYRNNTPSVFLVELCPVLGSISASLQETCRALNLQANTRQAVQMHRAICAKLRGTNALLVFDEAQNLSMRALDQVRCIHDRTKVGIALVGNEQVYSQIAGSNRPAYLDRLYSRIGKRIHLARAMPGDINALVEAMDIADGAARMRLCQIAGRPGALRVLQKVARLAGVYAAGEARALTLEDVEAAWADLGGLG